MIKRHILKILLCIYLVIILTSCHKLEFEFVEPDEAKLNCFIELKGTVLFVGGGVESTESYTLLKDKGNLGEELYSQKLGFFDFGLTESGVITNIRTASPEVVLNRNLHCGQTLEEFQSYMLDYTKMDLGDGYYLFFNKTTGCGVEIQLSDADTVLVIRMSTINI